MEFSLKKISIPLLNSAGPWSTTLEQLDDLYNIPYIGATTVRTSTLEGFPHKEDVHQYTFFDAGHQSSLGKGAFLGSLNTLGYSPLSLSVNLDNIATIIRRKGGDGPTKPIFISVTGTPDEVTKCVEMIELKFKELHDFNVCAAVEVNLSCPNITGKPPPAFTQEGLVEYLTCFKTRKPLNGLYLGIKLPPYSNPADFKRLEAALLESFASDKRPLGRLDFITTTNTLGCSLVLDDSMNPTLQSQDGSGIGGMAGAPLHPLSLGNVTLVRRILDKHPELSEVALIGVGGVSDAAGYKRMRAAGADAVAVGTAFGLAGKVIFEEICKAASLDTGL